ncbi:MAG: hypothetical protein WKG01_42525 [Kofleriaceae bacterium]
MATEVAGLTRFDAVRAALVGPLGAVTTRADQAYFGAALYSSDLPWPTLDTVDRALGNREAIDVLLADQTPRGEAHHAHHAHHAQHAHHALAQDARARVPNPK